MRIRLENGLAGVRFGQRRWGCVALAGTLLVGGMLAGCASPGVPRPPSLNLPAEVKDLTAMRRGDAVELRFTVPQRNTDHLLLKGDTVSAVICRAVGGGACVALAGKKDFARVTGNHATAAVMRDVLPAELAAGAARAVSYRVELFDVAGKTAGFSEPVYALAGAGLPVVSNLSAEGSRLGVVLSWPSLDKDGQVAVRREDLAPKPVVREAKTAAKPAGKSKSTIPVASHGGEEAGVVWLGVPAEATDKMLDTTAVAGESYRYVAEHRRTVQVGGRALEMRSEASAAVVFALRDVYPPEMPVDLTAAAFAVKEGDASAGIAVDLIWQPVEDAGLRGYNVYREIAGVKTKLTAEPVKLPAFHDVLGAGAGSVRYSVTAVSTGGNESAAVTTVVDASQP
jgi:hypothetical protein